MRVTTLRLSIMGYKGYITKGTDGRTLFVITITIFNHDVRTLKLNVQIYKATVRQNIDSGQICGHNTNDNMSQNHWKVTTWVDWYYIRDHESTESLYRAKHWARWSNCSLLREASHSAECWVPLASNLARWVNWVSCCVCAHRHRHRHSVSVPAAS